MGADLLVDRLEGAGDGKVVLELDGDPLVCERFEHREDQLDRSRESLRTARVGNKQTIENDREDDEGTTAAGWRGWSLR